jgi:hypothetical protein
MRLLIYIILFLLFMAQLGCKQVKTVQHETKRTDSTNLNNSTSEILKDSSFFSKDLKEKTIPKASTEISISQDSINSLIDVLKNLPKGTVIYKTDPTTQAQLTLALNKIGELTISCTSAEKKYYETTVTQGRIIEQLKSEVAKRDKIIYDKEVIIQEKQKNLFDKMSNAIGKGFTIAIFLAILILCAYGYFKLKK